MKMTTDDYTRVWEATEQRAKEYMRKHNRYDVSASHWNAMWKRCLLEMYGQPLATERPIRGLENA